MATKKPKSKKTAKTKLTAKAKVQVPKPKAVERQDGGPREWLVPMLEGTYSRLVPKEQEPAEEQLVKAEAEAAKSREKKPREMTPPPARALESRLQPGRGSDVLADTPRDFWTKLLREHQERKAQAAAPAAPEDTTGGGPFPAKPAVPGQNNWVPLGPSAVAKGQAVGRPTIAGRISGLALFDACIIYAASANGGVFRSDDGGVSWRSTMDGFDLDPTAFAAASLCCGAIAVSPTNSDRVYAGTGEGDTDALFTLRLTNALPSYRGIGPIRSDTGGNTWVSEPSTPDLAGFAFYQMAVDPNDQDNVVAATTNGLYQRVLSGSSVMWQQRRTGNHSSAVVCHAGGVTRFFAAAWGGPVYTSTNGSTWTTAGTGFPTGIGRVALAVQHDNPNVLYALVATTAGGLKGLYRLDGVAGAWKQVSGAPNIVPGNQGDYDLCIAVDPSNANLIYLGGDRTNSSPYPGNIQRCTISPSGSAYSAAATAIGDQAHADVHVLAFVPGNSDHLYTGTDGGCFLNTNPSGAGNFEARNTGLSCLCTNYLGLSASEPAVMFVGQQDNGTAKYAGEELWRGVLFGDGGYCVVSPTDPFTALAYANGTVYRTTTGGKDWGDWSSVSSPPWSIMAEPLVMAPNGTRVAFGAGAGIYVSNNFGASFTTSPTFSLPSGSGGIYSMVFATDTRLFIGTSNGRVFQADLSGSTWTATRIDNAAGGPLPLAGLVSDIAVDWADGTRASVYICFGGHGDQRHVWRFNGSGWQNRSGTGATGLLDVEHNAMLVDPANTAHVYVGADIGVWRSTDSGNTWATFELGLPDAPVMDLQLHAGARLLRASLHGRGVYEYRLNPPALTGIELYIRDTAVDTARGENTDGHNDPSTWPASQVWHWAAPNIKVDVPTPLGYQTPTNQIDFWQFHETIVDGSAGVATIDPPQVVHNRVYALVHNRGPLVATNVRVMAAVTNASTVLNPLPAGYAANIAAGTPIVDPNWKTLNIVDIPEVRPGFPKVAAFDLPSNLLPLPASLPGQSHYCLVTFLHAASDAFTNTQTNVDLLTVSERKVAQKNLHIVQFAGTPPPAYGMWVRLDITGFLFKTSGKINLKFDLAAFPGAVSMVLPGALLPDELLEPQKEFKAQVGSAAVKKWLNAFSRDAERLSNEGKFDPNDYRRVLGALKAVDGRPLLAPKKAATPVTLRGLPIRKRDRHVIFMKIDLPDGAKVGDKWRFSVVQSDEKGNVQGGADYIVRVNRPVRQ